MKHALGKGLSNRTRFGALKHPRTGEQDGAVFLLSLEERNLSYFASDAQDRRNMYNSTATSNYDISAAFENDGTVSVTNGRLLLSGGPGAGADTGTYAISAGARWCCSPRRCCRR